MSDATVKTLEVGAVSLNLVSLSLVASVSCKGKKSVAISVNIQSFEKSLNDNDLEKINNLIISTVENKSGAKIRS